MAMTSWPTRRELESPSSAVGRPVAPARTPPNDLGRKHSPIREAHLDILRPLDHVVVGEDEAVRGDDDPGPRPLLPHARSLGTLPDSDAHDRRPHLFRHADDGTRIGVEQVLVLLRTGQPMRLSVPPSPHISASQKFHQAIYFIHGVVRPPSSSQPVGRGDDHGLHPVYHLFFCASSPPYAALSRKVSLSASTFLGTTPIT